MPKHAAKPAILNGLSKNQVPFVDDASADNCRRLDDAGRLASARGEGASSSRAGLAHGKLIALVVADH